MGNDREEEAERRAEEAAERAEEAARRAEEAAERAEEAERKAEEATAPPDTVYEGDGAPSAPAPGWGSDIEGD
jgi:membrane protein involved in colicin uptake